MKLTDTQKRLRHNAKVNGESSIACMMRATDAERDSFRGRSRDEWKREAVILARVAASYAFDAHPELR